MHAGTGPVLARASLVLAGFAWVVPFLQPYHYYPLPAFYSEWLALALGLAAAVLLPLLPLKQAPGQGAALPAVALAPPALILLLGVHVALGRVPYPEQAVTAAFYLLWAMLMVILGNALRRELGMAAVAEALAVALVAGGLLSALAGLLQHYQVAGALEFLVSPKVSLAVHGNVQQPNHFAAYMTMALASVGYLHARARLRLEVAIACAGLMLLVLALAGSRSPWLYLVLLAALSATLHRRQRDASSRRLLTFTIALVPGFVVAQGIASLPFMTPDPLLHVTSAQRLFDIQGGIGPRLQLAREAWGLFLTAPAIGAGWGQFPWHHFLSAGGSQAMQGLTNHAHNIVLHLLAETGVAGAALIVSAAALWLWELRRTPLDVETWWLLALLAVIGTHSMLEFPLWYAYFLGPAALLLGLGAQRAWALRYSVAARIVLAVALATGAFNLIAVAGSYRELERVAFDPQQRAARELTDDQLAAAVARLYREPALVPYVELVIAHGIAITPERLAEKYELNARAMRFAPIPVVAYHHALLLALAGEPARARAHLELAASAYPDELDGVVYLLEQLARGQPGAFAPLLELAAARRAELRAQGALQ